MLEGWVDRRRVLAKKRGTSGFQQFSAIGCRAVIRLGMGVVLNRSMELGLQKQIFFENDRPETQNATAASLGDEKRTGQPLGLARYQVRVRSGHGAGGLFFG
jgi:hypothetical protein